MKKEVAVIWADALLSDKYKKGRNQLLNSKQEFCCLGVLCNEYKEHAGDTSIDWEDVPDTEYKKFASQTAVLPMKVAEWAGFDKQCPHVPVDSLIDKVPYLDRGAPTVSFVKLNDHTDLTFKDFAGLILANVEAIK